MSPSKTENNSAKNTITPPKAAKKEFSLIKHGHKRMDPYYWLKDRENKEVIDYLNKENDYHDDVMKTSVPYEKELFTEMKARMKEDDTSAPNTIDDYVYFSEVRKGQEYPLYFRRHKDSKKDELLIDVNELAKGQSYTQCTSPQPSRNHQIVAFGCDFVGRRFYNIRFKDLKTGKLLPAEIKNVSDTFTWANDNDTLFYVVKDAQTLREFQVYRYQLSTGKAQLVFEEKDETFYTGVYRSNYKKYVFIGSNSTLSSEIHYVSADTPTDDFKVFAKRKRNHEYHVTDAADGFYIRTNMDGAKNFKIMKTAFGKTPSTNWKEFIRHRKDVYIDDFTTFKTHIVVAERFQGLTRLSVRSNEDKTEELVQFPDPAYTVSIGSNNNYDTNVVRYIYESPRAPETYYDYNFKTKKSVVIKQQEVPTYNANNYRVERLWVKARDGVKVPVTLFMKKDFKPEGKNPIMITGYGSYGISNDPYFSSSSVSLVDRGFVFAVAHIRGGGELGRSWTDDGRTLKKKNTFYDFIDVTEELVKQGYSAKDKVFAKGGSAGGLLMGAIMNMRPDLYRGIIAQVPFVDVVTTMLDDSIPLTTGEYDEWGNPNVKKFYDYIVTYSPYDNVKAQNYPNVLITSGLHDSQVQYWEPTKWAARLRDYSNGPNKILLRTNMDAGHGGASGRYQRIKEVSQDYSFLIGVLEGRL